MDPRERLPNGFALVGGYRITRDLGSGGFGITYQAEDLKLGVPVAIKEYIPAAFGGRNSHSMHVHPLTMGHGDLFDWGRKRFLEEAMTLAKVKHPNIVSVLRYFEANNTAYMVLAYESGASMDGWLKRLGRQPTQEELDAVVVPLLDALGALHANGMLHRDLAPDNVIIRDDGGPVLLDFGAARRAIAERTQVMTAIVKDGFSPPEQYSRDSTHQGACTDIYALGAILYLAVTGQRPVAAPERQLGKDLALLAGNEALASAYRPSFLAGIDRCLTIVPQARPATVADAKALLAPPKIVTTLPPAERPPISGTELFNGPTLAPVPAQPRFRPALLIVACLLAVGALSYAFRSEQPPAQLAGSQQGDAGKSIAPDPNEVRRAIEKQREDDAREAAAAERRAAEAERQRTAERQAQAQRAEQELIAAQAREAAIREAAAREAEQRRVDEERRAAEVRERAERERIERERAERERAAQDAQARQAVLALQASQEARLLDDARACIGKTSDACVQAVCYDTYVARYGAGGTLAATAAAERASLERQCRAGAVPPAAGAAADGIYTGRVSPACGEGPQSVQITIDRGRIAFEHAVGGISYQWNGTLDAAGAIAATVGGNAAFSARGTFHELTVELRYPQCNAAPFVMRIRGRVG